jgi:hypothetical protein
VIECAVLPLCMFPSKVVMRKCYMLFVMFGSVNTVDIHKLSMCAEWHLALRLCAEESLEGAVRLL